MIEWINVRSTAIRRIGYNANTMHMYVDFEDSDPVYTFDNWGQIIGVTH